MPLLWFMLKCQQFYPPLFLFHECKCRHSGKADNILVLFWITIKQMERYLSTLVVMELQIKTSMRYYFMSKKMGKNCKFCEHRGLLWIRCNRNFPFWPVVVCIATTPGKHFGCNFRTQAYLMTQQFYPRENCICWNQDRCTRIFITALFVVVKNWKRPNVHQQ